MDVARTRLGRLESSPNVPSGFRAELLEALEELRIAEEELKAQNEALSEAHAEIDRERRRYQELFDLAPEGYLLTDLNGIIRQGNVRAASLVGVRPTFLPGKALAAFVSPEDRGDFRTELSGLPRATGPVHLAARLRLRNGRQLSAAISVAVVRDDEGLPTGLRWLVRDATEQARAMADLKRRESEARDAAVVSESHSRHVQKLESIGVLAGGIAHDLNNLLHVILGNADLMIGDMAPDDPGQQSLGEILRATHQAADLTRHVLAYSGTMPVAFRQLDLSREVRAMGSLLRTVISKQATLVYDLASDLPPVRADHSQIRQVVMNLITNASDALGEASGTITLRTMRSAESPGEVCLEVTDTGIGMEVETVARIFDPFFSTKYSGRGLGLAAVMGILSSHHGRVRVKSAPGAGTTFHLDLPAAEGPVEFLPPEAPEQAPWRGSGTVLVVEDEEGVRNVSQRMISDLGFATIAAADGREAVGIMDRLGATVAAVLLDLSMPRMGGRAAFRLIRARWPHVPVVITSGYTQESVTPFGPEASDLRACYLQKPFLQEDLMGAFQRILESHPIEGDDPQ